MDLKYSGFLFVLMVILEAISGSELNNSSTSKNIQDLSTIHPITGKSQSENGSTAESVKIIIHNTSEITSKSKLSENDLTKVSPIAVNAITNTTPAAEPEMGHWVVRNDSTNTICIIADMAMQLNITYPGKNQTFESAIVNVPSNATASGNCSESLQSLNITWGPGHSLEINFNANNTVNNFFISGLSLNVNATVFKNTTGDWRFVNRSSHFMTPLEMSYKCNKLQDINLKSTDSRLKAVLSLRDTQFEAYMNKTKPEFGAAQDCDTFDTPDVVPIAVGCALAILVLVVLVAYLIGRKRSQNRGYLSM